jgi:hypothetical protein
VSIFGYLSQRKENAVDARNPVANPLIVLREEFDDWAILFDPDTGNAFGLNPTGVFIWKLLDGKPSRARAMWKAISPQPRGFSSSRN